MTVAHQFTRQLDEKTADAVFGNVGSMIAFQVGSDDAEILVRQLRKFEGQLLPEDLTNIPKYAPKAPTRFRSPKPTAERSATVRTGNGGRIRRSSCANA